ncbi:MAG: response regulator [Suipraeoptans sp.]
MKISIYIVDDETLAIKYLKRLLLDAGLDCEIIGEATNGTKALPEIFRLQPDIIFTDIRMPVMDGLELAEKVLEKLSPKIFFVTSYKDFDYVKQGIKLGITDYILKNDLSEESLRELLEKTIQNLIAEKKQKHLILSHNVRAFLLSDTNEIEDHVYEHVSLQRYALINVVKRPRIHLKHEKIWEKLQVGCYELQSLVYPDGIRCSAFSEVSQEEYCGIFFISEKVDDAQAILKVTAELIKQLFYEYDTTCVCIISDTMQHFFDLQEGYKRVKKMAGYTYAYPKKDVFNLVEESSFKCVRSVDVGIADIADIVSSLDVVNSHLRKGKRIDALTSLENFFNECSMSMDISEYSEQLSRVQLMLRNYAVEKGIPNDCFKILETYDSTENVTKSFIKAFTLIFAEEDKFQMENYSHYIRQTIQYIRKNYNKDISIPDIANAVNISEGHLRRLFKNELNMRVVDYITAYRLELAKKLMEDPNENKSDIWKRTGFASAQYFSYVFKRKEGMLPKDYLK